KLSARCMPVNPVPNNFWAPPFGYAVDCANFQCNKMHPNDRAYLVKNMMPLLSFVNSLKRLHSCGELHANVATGEVYNVADCFEHVPGADSSEEKTSTKEVDLGSFSNYMVSFSCEDHKENQRRRKIGLANKGKVPWNKGIKHSAETRERIRQRTKEALRDPKVRKKMSECPRAHSKRTKARIRSSLRWLWDERLKWKRSREKFFLSWKESIAKAAKQGGTGQEELNWDSYDGMKKEIAPEQLQWAANKAKAKEMARIRAERAAQIHRKKSIYGQVTSQDHRAWEIFYPEFMKREQMQREVSLADQIRAVKNRRAGFVAMEAQQTSTSIHPSHE
ncbi:hypothetical protein RJ639_039863, partial [Escallonia herrerae]